MSKKEVSEKKMSSNNNSGSSEFYDAENVQNFEEYEAENQETEYVQNYEEMGAENVQNLNFEESGAESFQNLNFVEIGAENGEAESVQYLEENGAEYYYFYEENLTDDKAESFETAKSEETQERPDNEEVQRKFFQKNPENFQFLFHYSFSCTEETAEVAGNATSLSFLQVSPIVAEPALAELCTEMPGTSSTSLTGPPATPLVTSAERNVDMPSPKSNTSEKSSYSIDDAATQVRSRSLNFSARSPVTRSMTRQSAASALIPKPIVKVSTTKTPKRLARKSHTIEKRVGKAAKKAPAKKTSKGGRSTAKK